MISSFNREHYAKASACWQTLQRLHVVDDIRVERLLHANQLWLQRVTSKRVAMYRVCVVRYDFAEARGRLARLRSLGAHFSEESLVLDLDALDRHYSYCEAKQASERLREQYHRAEHKRYAAEHKQLLGVPEEQIAKIREENVEALRQQAEALSLTQALHAEELARLEASNAKLKRDYEEQLASAEREKASFKAAYEKLLLQQREEQKQSESDLKEEIARLEARQVDRETLVSQTMIPPQAFGRQEWGQYFGEVEAAPSLPLDMDKFLDSPCPFWPEKAVKDTHLLVLIPSTVAGKPFSLNLLKELIKCPRGGGYPTKYRVYDGGVKKALGAQSPGSSYWVLMTRDVLESSKNKKYVAQKALVAARAREMGLPYELPGVLEAATAILSHYVRSGERLYLDSPYTFTRCRESVLYKGNSYPVAVGGFSSGGFLVHGSSIIDRSGSRGVASLRKL